MNLSLMKNRQSDTIIFSPTSKLYYLRASLDTSMIQTSRTTRLVTTMFVDSHQHSITSLICWHMPSRKSMLHQPIRVMLHNIIFLKHCVNHGRFPIKDDKITMKQHPKLLSL